MAVERDERRLLDAFGRRLEYLRLSVTDRCDFRCSYCLPHGCARASGAPPLGVDEIGRLARAFAELGFTKLRITGGEPTVREDVVAIVERIAAVRGVRHVGLTTNGARLGSIVHDLADAGLTCLNVSVDSLDPARFAAVTGRPVLARVLEGIEAAIAARIPRVKVNVVLLAGTDAAEIERFLAWSRHVPLTIRFIELMGLGVDPDFYARHHVATAELEGILDREGWRRLPPAPGNGPSVDYAKPGHLGRVGIIAPWRHDTCARCNRLRVTARGDLRLCLFDPREVPLRHLLASDDQRRALVDAVRSAVAAKPAAHPAERAGAATVRGLASIGG